MLNDLFGGIVAERVYIVFERGHGRLGRLQLAIDVHLSQPQINLGF